jgi:hypothetical protein
VKAGGSLAGRPAGGHHRAPKAVEKRYPGLYRVICSTPLGTQLSTFSSKTLTGLRRR